MKSPKTTTVAILAILAGGARALYTLFSGEGFPNTEDIALVLSGIGFLFARDNDRTDTESGAHTAEQNRLLKRAPKPAAAPSPLPHGPKR